MLDEVKNVSGIYLPPQEEHYANHPDLGRKYPSLEAALNLLPEHRRRQAFDVGAHVGLWSRWLVKEFKLVQAFEPVKNHCRLFRQNVKAKNFVLHEFAVGESVGRVRMKQYLDNTGQAHIDGVGLTPMWPLDLFKNADVDLIKIDVEGYELPCVKGAERLLMANRPVMVIEQRGLDAEYFGEECNAALTWLKAKGMKVAAKVDSDYILTWPSN